MDRYLLFVHKNSEFCCIKTDTLYTGINRVSVQGVKSLGGHFACLCRGFEFYEVKQNYVIIFKKENGNTFTLLIIFVVKSKAM